MTRYLGVIVAIILALGVSVGLALGTGHPHFAAGLTVGIPTGLLLLMAMGVVSKRRARKLG